MFFLKTSLILILGYTYLSILTTSEFVLNLFNILTWNFESSKAKYQHILINYILNMSDSTGKVDEIKILFFDDDIKFNMKNFFSKFFFLKLKI